MQYNRVKYPDGGVYAVVTDFSNPVITERINTYEDLFFIKSIKEACDYNDIDNVELNIPCMFQQQHDRRFNKNESFELQIVADFINSCGFKKVRVFHPHSDATQIALKKCHPVDNSKYITEVLNQLNLSEKPLLLSTDGGSFKWINKMADVINFTGEVYGASKSRDAVTHKLVQMIDRQDFEGRDVIVVDDLCVFGGTFLGLSKMLRERNVGKLYLAISHVTVPNPNKALETAYDRIFCTNSKYNQYDLNNLTIINIEDLKIFE